MPARKPAPSRATLLHYVEQDYSNRDLAKHFGVSTQTCWKWCAAYGLHTHGRMGPTPRTFDMDHFAALVEAGSGKKTIASALGCGVDTVDRLLRESGMKTRRQQEGRRKPVRRVMPSAKALLAANPFGLVHGKNFCPPSTGAATGAAVVFFNGDEHAAA